MSLRIRLQKPGKSVKRRYHYKIVVAERSFARDGRAVDFLGFYDPSKNPRLLKIDLEKYDQWVGKGASPTETVASLYKSYKKQQIKKES